MEAGDLILPETDKSGLFMYVAMQVLHPHFFVNVNLFEYFCCPSLMIMRACIVTRSCMGKKKLYIVTIFSVFAFSLTELICSAIAAEERFGDVWCLQKV